MALHTVPVSGAVARRFILDWHRHHRPPQGYLLCLGVADDNDVLHGVVVVGRPVARLLQDGLTVEVTRCCTDGIRNACSYLYGSAARTMKTLGYRRIITYTQGAETGASLRGAGWRRVADRAARAGWNAPSRPREVSGSEWTDRVLWEQVLHPGARLATSLSRPSPVEPHTPPLF
ncbi:XF1762 family protein [Streptosporangium lutulentum]|uniref:Uncharacterized protein n=1 Tax=Streptosporangium lutulentum TaxID=1461250 RepID=A0ABT9QUC9_9ACTN|nr:XF1762 family protein [Streptosporangium lutulentum]MDP9850367.1 hypothetical protein [Streptosporangium lutulentum]